MSQSHVTPPRPGASNITPMDDHEPAFKDVVVELWQNVEKLMRQQLALASAELDVKAQQLKREVAAFGAAAGMILAGVFALVAGIILLLSLAMPAWVAALAVGATLTGGGVMLLQRRPPVSELSPDRTLQSIKKDVQIFTEVRK